MNKDNPYVRAYIKELTPEKKDEFEIFNNSHTLYIDTKVFCENWNAFNQGEVSIRKKNFIDLEIKINGKQVTLDKTTRHYFPYPNKTYLAYGHPANKKGVPIKIEDTEWENIKAQGFVDITLTYTLQKEIDANEKLLFAVENPNKEDDEVDTLLVDQCALSIKMHIKDIEKGEHLLVGAGSYGLCHPIAVFRQGDFDRLRKSGDEDESYISRETHYYPNRLDLDNDFVGWSFFQKLEFETTPYSLYYSDKKNGIEYIQLLGVLQGEGYKNRGEKIGLIKITGVISEEKENLGE